jgi:tyrosyl-tRNA synthetase
MTSESSRSFFEELQWRGLLTDATPGIDAVLRNEKIVGYIGFDPSASSLHVGSLVPVMALARMQRCGHSPIALTGGGTGLIGDPSGKKNERALLTAEQVESNLQGIKQQLSRFLDFDGAVNAARIVNNADWLTKISFTDFLRDVGKHFKVNVMLTRESVRRRLDSEEGISFTEFSYMLLQAYDFLVLYQKYHCTLQMGGSDQWGNIVAGTDLVGRVAGGKAYGIVFPLVTTAAGEKFGKTEAGTIWLDPERTSPYHFYQFWLRADDRDVIKYLKYFTWLGAEEIGELERQVQTAPETRSAQRRLAEEVTRIVHGEEPLGQARRVSELFFSEDVANLSADEILQVVSDAPSTDLSAAELGSGMPLPELLTRVGLASSKNEARRFIESGGIYLSNRQLTDPRRAIAPTDSIAGKILLLRKGKSNYHVVRIVNA